MPDITYNQFPISGKEHHMKTWAHCVRDARLIYINRDRFAYLYGSNGEQPTTYQQAQALVNELWNLYPDHFKATVTDKGHTKTELIWHIVGKICYDCSSFVCAVTQSEGSIYALKVKNDMNSKMLHDACKIHTSLQQGKWGSLLYRPGHCAIDAGNGLQISFDNEFLDCREYRFVDPNPISRFDDSSELPWVDYTGSINQ